MKLRRWLIVVTGAVVVGAALTFAIRQPRAVPRVPTNAAARTDNPGLGDLYVLTVGVEPKLTAQGKRDPYAADAWFVRRALAAAEPLYATTHSRVLAGGQATRAGVLEALAWLGNSVAERDAAVIFFSTHGSIATPGSGAPKTGFYVDLAGAGMLANLDDGVLWDSELNAALAKVRGRAVLLLDTCHSGGMIPAGGAMDHRAAVVTACGASEDSYGQWETPDRPHGWFVIALCEALDGLADANRDGVVTLAEVISYVPARANQLAPKQNAVVLPREGLLELPLARIDRNRPAAELWPPKPRPPAAGAP